MHTDIRKCIFYRAPMSLQLQSPLQLPLSCQPAFLSMSITCVHTQPFKSRVANTFVAQPFILNHYILWICKNLDYFYIECLLNLSGTLTVCQHLVNNLHFSFNEFPGHNPLLSPWSETSVSPWSQAAKRSHDTWRWVSFNLRIKHQIIQLMSGRHLFKHWAHYNQTECRLIWLHDNRKVKQISPQKRLFETTWQQRSDEGLASMCDGGHGCLMGYFEAWSWICHFNAKYGSQRIQLLATGWAWLQHPKWWWRWD